jgi:outer membrane biosynthesis protein TonB
MSTALAYQHIRSKALLWTIGIHLLLLLLFFLFHYTLPITPANTDNGLEVNLGTSADGSGADQPMKQGAPREFKSAVIYHQQKSSGAMLAPVTQSTPEDAPAINESRRKHEQQMAADGASHPQPRPQYLYPGSTGSGGNNAPQNAPGTSEGNTTGNGDRGVPGGTPGAANYSGTPGSGTGGVSHTLINRQISPDRFEATFHEGGKVVIRVSVDRDGNIVSKILKSSSNPELTRIAMDKLSKAHFSKSESSDPQQFGDVTIIFKTRS